MEAEVCKNCWKKGTCSCEREACGTWLTWFRKEWAGIRKAAAMLKNKQNGTTHAKMRIYRESTRAEIEERKNR